jgi:hypothetical protein
MPDFDPAFENIDFQVWIRMENRENDVSADVFVEFIRWIEKKIWQVQFQFFSPCAALCAQSS